MRVAVPAETGNGLESAVAEHFGRCPYFVLADLSDNTVESVNAVANPYYGNHRPGQVPAFIHDQQVNVLISGGIGAGAISFFQQYGIEVATGATGTVGQAIERYLNGELSADASCAGHHDGGGCHQ